MWALALVEGSREQVAISDGDRGGPFEVDTEVPTIENLDGNKRKMFSS